MTFSAGSGMRNACKKVKVSLSLIAEGAGDLESTVSWAQPMKDGVHPSPFAALAFPN